MKPAWIKKGDTFVLNGVYKDRLQRPQSLVGVDLFCDVRTSSNELVANLTLIRLDDLNGKFRFVASSTSWPLGVLFFDIKESVGGIILHTQTEQFEVRQAVTL